MTAWEQHLALMREDLPGALGIATAILLLFGAAEAWRRLSGVPTEWTRKLTHMGAGAIVLSFPWVIQSAWTTVLLALAFGGLLVLGKISGQLQSIHDVERRTSGAYYYPLAVLGLFVLSRRDPLLYCVPLAVMAAADTGAAVVGKAAGGTRYRVLQVYRRFEVSLAFLVIAFAVVLVGLGLEGRVGWPESLLVTLVVATLTTAVEAVSVRGSDNLLIPYAAWMVLHRTMKLGLPSLEPWTLGMAGALAVLAVGWRRANFTVAGGVTVFVVGSLAWALGGWPWAGPLMALLVLMLAAPVLPPQADVDEVFATCAGSLALILAFGHSGSDALWVPYMVTVSANGAILGRRLLGPLGLVLGALVPLVGAAGNAPWTVALGGMAGGLIFLVVERAAWPGRRMAASLLVGLAALLMR